MENQTSTVCLDGVKVKYERERHGLTQLYVSKVVGVTTDTISRWENNRYPTIRRENAINLADALGVPLEDILRKAEAVASTAESPADTSRRLWLFAGGFLLLLCGLGVWFSVSRQVPMAVTIAAERILPAFAAPETAIPVQLRIIHSESGGFILKESFPEGWQLIEAFPPPSSLDNVHGLARWIVKPGGHPDRVVYLVEAASVTAGDGVAHFYGEIIAGAGDDRASLDIGGDNAATVARHHWADANGDGRIDDVEMLDTSYTVDEMAGVHIDWNELERLWDAGGYHWDAAMKSFVPVVSTGDPGR